MKLVTLTRDMRPYGANADILVPDGVAQTLVASGDARDPREYPPRTPAKTPAQPAAARYKTKRV